jgi:hypothetical protein
MVCSNPTSKFLEKRSGLPESPVLIVGSISTATSVAEKNLKVKASDCLILL